MHSDTTTGGTASSPSADARSGEPRPAVAVLGANGSIGRHVVSAFETTGYRVLAVARKRPPTAAGAGFLELDLSATSPAELAEVLTAAGAQVMVNAVGGWSPSTEDNQHVHVELVRRLLDAAALMPAPPRLVQIGSVHEYGPVPHGTVTSESREPRPQTPYARSKLAGTEAVLRATGTGQVQGIVLRVVNVFGPDAAAGSFLGSVVRRLRALPAGARLRLEVSRDERDYVDVRDLADAVVRAAESPLAGRTVNIGRGEALDMRRMLGLLVAEAGQDPDVLDLTTGPVSSNGGAWTRADIRSARRLLGWAPKIDVRQSLRDMWEAAAEL
ncbi:NAD-dependent epimerase/dehydratase family protein [Streptomyces sp. NPDC001068]|uniref:NAD-dependent epimerase/dehydratase family protein n=1 Tax=Streptomyces sp. NPDC001068 TaxID=3364544 RepID=UPI0036B13EC3